MDLATLIVSSGWAKVRELSASSVANESSVETARKDALRAAEAEAKAEGRGLWNGRSLASCCFHGGKLMGLSRRRL